jgi:hypothetical protein
MMAKGIDPMHRSALTKFWLLPVLLLIAASAPRARAAENPPLFVDNFDQRPLHGAPSADLWTVLPFRDKGQIVIGGIGNEATRNWCTLAGAGEAGLRSRAFTPDKEAWASLSIRMEGGETCAIALCDARGQFPYQLQLVHAKGNTYDAVILSQDRSAAGQPLRQRVARNMPLGQWHRWTFGVKTVDAFGYYWVYRDGQPLAQSVLSRSVTRLPAVDHLEVSGQDPNCSFSDVAVYRQSPLAGPVKQNADAYIEPQSHQSVDYDLEVAPNGGLTVRIGKASYQVRSAFSRVGGGMQWIGSPVNSDAQDHPWPLEVKKESDGVYQVTAVNDHYTLRRRIERFGNRVAVSDQLTNRTDELLGVRFLNEVSSADAEGGSRVCGTAMPSPSSLNQPERPFIQVVTPDNSLGMITRDDVYRNQSVCYADAESYGIRDDHFALAPHASYTTHWELYPVATTSSFDFINTVRHVWKTDRLTVPGLFAFVYPQRTWAGDHKRLDQMSVSDMKQWLQATGIDTIAFVIAANRSESGIESKPFNWPFPFLPVEAFGEDYYRADLSKAFWKPILQRLHQAKPDIRLLPYFHCGANPLNPRFNDARVLNQDGKQKTWRFYDRYTRYEYYPTTSNQFGQAVEKIFDDLHAAFGQDGIYWDEFGHGNRSVYMYGVPDWDGHSAIIDPLTNKVKQKVTNFCLITQPVRTRLAKKVLSQGQVLWTNWQPTTQADMALNVPHFIEWFRPQEAARGYLSSPITLGGRGARSNAEVIRQVHDYLEYGLLYAHIAGGAYAETTPSVLKYCFPITPVQLDAGYIIGNERILTARSGRFGFGEKNPLYAIVYGADGLRQADVTKNATHDGKTYCELSLQPGEVAIVLRKK